MLHMRAYSSGYCRAMISRKLRVVSEATHAGVVGIPVIVYVVSYSSGSGNSQNDVFLLGLRERHPLAPEAADGYHYFQSVMGDVVQRTRKRGMLQNGIDNHIVPVNLFKSNLPFAVALFLRCW